MNIARLLVWLGCLTMVAGCSAPQESPVAPEPVGVPGHIPVTFTTPGKGLASVALYDREGVLVRSLLYAAPVSSGRQTVDWDGTTDMGKPAAVGEYAVKGVFFTEPPQVKFVMEVGKSGNPPWRTRDGKGDWGGNLGAPASIVSSGKTLLFAYGCVEDNQITGIQQMDGDGNIALRYYSFYPWDTRLAAAMDEKNYYLGIYNWDKKRVEIAEYTLGQPRGRILTQLPAKPMPDRSENRWHGRLTGSLDGLVVTKDTLYASVADNNALYIVNRTTGKVLKTIAVPGPRGLVWTGDSLLVVSGTKVLRLNPAGAVTGTVVDQGVLQNPHALAADAAGNLYVGDSGGDGGVTVGSRQVVVFSPEGKLLRRLGKAGGTPQNGRFDENGMGTITSLCIGPGANGAGAALWVNDIATGFPRTSRWSLAGQLERQWFARKLCLYSDCFNPAKPSELIVTSGPFADEPGISAYQMDLTAGTWKPSWHYDNTWADMYQEEVYLSFTHGGNPYDGARARTSRWPVFGYESRHFVTYQGRNYFMSESGNGDGAVFTYGADQKPKPVALVGFHRSEKIGNKIESIYDQGPNNWFTWADRNGDGKMALDEIIYTPEPAALAQTKRVSSARLDENLNVILSRLVEDKDGPRLVESKLMLKELLPTGAPVYDWGQMRDTVKWQLPDLTGGDGWKRVQMCNMALATQTESGAYALLEPEYAQKSRGDGKPLVLPGIDGNGWWASRNWRTKVARFDAQGRCLWAVGRRAPGRASPGQMYHPCHLAGVAGGAVFVTDTLGPVWVWSQDGLYLGRLFHDYQSGIEDDQVLYGETQATGVFTDPATGHIYSVANDTGAHIHRVILPTLTPLTAPAVRLTAALAAGITAWDPDGKIPTERPEYTALYTRNPPEIERNFNAFWLGENMPAVPSAQILLDGQHLAEVQVLYDEKNLYLHYDVQARHGLKNSGSELPYAPFVSGAYVDFSLAPHWPAPRAEVKAGDVRVLMTDVGTPAKPVPFQQGYWQVQPGGSKPQTISSPAATVHFDHIDQVPGLVMASKVLETDGTTGLTHYVIQASVPLSSLGLANPAGMKVGFDASVGVANAAGNRRERAGHWAGLSEGVVVDRPGSAQLLPETWGTLTFAPRVAPPK
jgi:hypothetical protein